MNLKFIVSLVLLLSILSCGEDETIDISLNFKLLYNNEPLVMLEEYSYPTGEQIKFTRFSFYMSNIQAESGPLSRTISDVELINLSRSHSDLPSSINGFEYEIKDMPLDISNDLSFVLGVDRTLNKNIPSDFSGDHPLANSGEYWIAWDSYIFFKIEGIVDLDGDGETETNVALHIGSDEASRRISIPINNQNEIDINIDVNSIFQNGSDIFDIQENPQIHSLNQIDQANFLMDNFSKQLNI